MRTGKVIKYIRVSKKLKSKNIYTNILSRPAISKFEKGLSDTTTEKFFKILDNLNVTLEEFHFIYNGYKRNIDHIFLDEYLEAFYLKDIKKLNELKYIMKYEYKKTNKINKLHYSSLCELTVNYLLNKRSNVKTLNILKNYLLECENWTYYELMLFTNSLDFFPEELVVVLYKRAKKKLEEYQLFNKFDNEVSSLITNILVVFITNNDTKKSSFFYNELKSSMSNSKNKVYDGIMLAFFEELIAIMLSKVYDHKKIEVIISIFTELDMPLKTAQCLSLFETVKRNNGLFN